jgi:hypothetical protein
MAKKKALSDNQRTGIGFVVTALLAVIVYMSTIDDANRPPEYVYVILGGIAVVAQLAKDQLGVRDSSTSRVSKEVNPGLRQFREPADSQIPKTTSSV